MCWIMNMLRIMKTIIIIKKKELPDHGVRFQWVILPVLRSDILACLPAAYFMSLWVFVSALEVGECDRWEPDKRRGPREDVVKYNAPTKIWQFDTDEEWGALPEYKSSLWKASISPRATSTLCVFVDTPRVVLLEKVFRMQPGLSSLHSSQLWKRDRG